MHNHTVAVREERKPGVTYSIASDSVKINFLQPKDTETGFSLLGFLLKMAVVVVLFAGIYCALRWYWKKF